MTTSSATNLLRRMTAVMFTCLLVASLFLVSTPASASDCRSMVGRPYKASAPLRISAQVINYNCNGTDARLERRRWFGWQTIEEESVARGKAKILSWNCAKVGTYTYRTVYWAGPNEKRTSPTFRTSC